MGVMMEDFATAIFFTLLLFILPISTATDTINTTQLSRDGDTLISASGSFTFGFFSPGNSQKRYLGIWYTNIPTTTAVWVANREIPLPDKSGIFMVTSAGSLLLDRHNTSIWSANSTRLGLNPVAQLLDSGNLVLRDGSDNDPDNFLWQSFDYPCDTFLAGMKLGRDMTTGLDRYITSWKNADDPSAGHFTYRLDPNGYPQLTLRQGSTIKLRLGPWDGQQFSGTPGLKPTNIYEFTFVLNDKEMYYTYEILSSSIVSRLVMNSNGFVQRSTWVDRTQGWIPYLSAPADNCDNYAMCGAYGSCNIDAAPVCGCLKGFLPLSPNEWNLMDYSNGCIRRKSLDCQTDIFLKYSNKKLPDTRQSWFNKSITLQDCEGLCQMNCSCTAYTSLDIRDGGSGCLLWFGNLTDIRETGENGQDLYIRMAASELGASSLKRFWIIVTSVLLTAMLFLGPGLTLYHSRRRKKQQQQLYEQVKMEHILDEIYNREKQKEELELPLFDWATIAAATNNFSNDNKLGEGGFGPVYKGTLRENEGHQEIAVKKLSKNSNQGPNEFKNEVQCIAKLQHRNLVKLLGCCIENEKMLIYEYMPNKSLNNFIFDQTQRKILSWTKRFNIINGIARGLLYLHQDSRLRVIHRDLKASNILLDHEMNPKISDFGLARCFGGNETEANTNILVGTFGYIAPEYAMEGIFSTKSDVFSYGVLVLETVSGKKTRGFCHPDHNDNLIGHAWRLFNEGRSMELMDELVIDSFSLDEVLRSIHVALLCVQQSPKDRPCMSTVVLMLGSEGPLSQPKQPAGFFTDTNPFDRDSSSASASASSSKRELCSVNELTITALSAR